MSRVPVVSICIPTCNQADYLPFAIQSALSQSLEDIEVVASVNHCTDHTEDVLTNSKGERLKIVRPE